MNVLVILQEAPYPILCNIHIILLYFLLPAERSSIFVSLQNSAKPKEGLDGHSAHVLHTPFTTDPLLCTCCDTLALKLAQESVYYSNL